MARILLSAMYCEPNRGSEEGVGWHFASELARAGHHVTVLVHSRYRAAIDRHLKDHPEPRLTIHDLDHPDWLRRLERLVPVPDQWAHEVWQFAAWGFVRQHLEPQSYDLIWHVTIGVVRQASLLYGFGVPFVFGPVAGGETSPRALRGNFGLRDHATEFIRDMMNWLMPFDVVLRRMLDKSVCIFARSPETRALIPSRARERTYWNLGIGVDHVPPAVEPKAAPVSKHCQPAPLRALFVGRLLYWKQPLLAIDAFARFLAQGGSGQFVLYGSGRMAQRCARRIEALGLQDRIQIVDFLPQAEFFEALKESDVLIFPSLHDGGGMAVLEAMAHGVPAIVFDLGGPGQLVTDGAGVRIATDGLGTDGAVDAMASALLRLQSDPDWRMRLSAGARERARVFLWSEIIAQAQKTIDAELAREGVAVRLAQDRSSSGPDQPVLTPIS